MTKATDAVVGKKGVETGDHFKNGASPKSLMSRGNFKIFVLIFVLAAGMLAVKSCKKDEVPTVVPKSVIDKVNEPEPFPEALEWGIKHEIVQGTGTTKTEGTDEDITNTKSTKASESDCHAYNTTWTCDTIKYSASQNPEKFCIFNPNSAVLWPGNLVQGETLKDGVLAGIPVAKRQPGNITLTIVSSGSDGATMYRTVDKMQLSSVTQAMNDILSDYPGHGSADYAWETHTIQSNSQLNFEIDAGYTGGPVKTNAAFGVSLKKDKTYIMVSLHQSYFSMAYDDPAGLDGIFTPDITVKDLENYTGNGNPICYISEVTYGRMYYLLYESDVTEDELNAALNFSYKGVFASADDEVKLKYEKMLQEANVYIVHIGGNAEGGFTTGMAKSLEAIADFVEKGANFSKDNIGFPISYTVRYLKNARVVRMNNTMEYRVQDCEAVSTPNVCPKLPDVVTNAVTTYTATTAMLGGIIIKEGTPEYYERGVCYSSTTQDPTIADGKLIISGTGEGSFSNAIDGLIPETKYFVKAYATSEIGTGYGDPEEFITPKLEVVTNKKATVVTNTVTNLTATTATLNGNITDAGIQAYTVKGFVYATTPNPEIGKNGCKDEPVSGTEIGKFTFNVTGLTPNTRYYVQAYAINTEGIAYSSVQIDFMTSNDYYMDEKGVIQMRPSSAKPVTTSTTNMTSGWYYLTSNVTVNSRITVNGDVNLILTDTYNFTANYGINVTGSNKLTIYAQSTGSTKGRLNAKSSSNAAGIGGNSGQIGGNVIINGGEITATGAAGGDGSGSAAGTGGGAGIGGGAGGDGGYITINGGTVKATGGKGGKGGPSAVAGGTGKGGGGAGAGIGGGGGTGGGHDSSGAAGGNCISYIKNGGTIDAIGGSKGTYGGMSGGWGHGGGGGGGGAGADIGGGGGGGGGGAAGGNMFGSNSGGDDGSASKNGIGGNGGNGGNGGHGSGGTAKYPSGGSGGTACK